jgi:bifunctional DNase/RNase
MPAQQMIDVALSRIVYRDGADRQYIFLAEVNGSRGFPIVIGNNEADEIRRVVHGLEPERPLTHQLTFNTIQALGGRIESVDIVDLKQNTYYAQIQIEGGGTGHTSIDARPSDAIALALRAKCRIRVTEDVLTRASDGKAP